MAFIRHVIYGEQPTLGADEDRRLLRALEVDLIESGYDVEQVSGGLRLPDPAGRTVVLGHPITPGEAGSVAGRACVAGGKPHVVVDKLKVDRALPAAVREATQAKTDNRGEFSLPAFLRADDYGCPVYDPTSLANEEGPESLTFVSIEGAPTGTFVVQLSRPTLELVNNGAFAAGAWVAFSPTSEDDFVVNNKDRTPRLLVSKAGAFNATRDQWTFGLPRLRKDKVHILYQSRAAPRTEAPRAEDVKTVGRLFGAFVDGVFQHIGDH